MAKLSKNKKLLKFEAGARYDAKTDSFSIYTTDEDFEGLPFKMNVINGSPSHSTLLEVMQDHGFDLNPTIPAKDLDSPYKILKESPKYPDLESLDYYIPIGMSSSGENIQYNLTKDTICYGKTNSGKTNFSFSVIAGAVFKGWDVTVVSDNKKDYIGFSGIVNMMYPKTFEEFIETFEPARRDSKSKKFIVIDTARRGFISYDTNSIKEQINSFKKVFGHNYHFLIVQPSHLPPKPEVFDSEVEIVRGDSRSSFKSSLNVNGRKTYFSSYLFEDFKILELFNKPKDRMHEQYIEDQILSEEELEGYTTSFGINKLHSWNWEDFTKNYVLTAGFDSNDQPVEIDLKKTLRVFGDDNISTKSLEMLIIAGLIKSNIEVTVYKGVKLFTADSELTVSHLESKDSLKDYVIDTLSENEINKVLILHKGKDFSKEENAILNTLLSISKDEKNNFNLIIIDPKTTESVRDHSDSQRLFVWSNQVSHFKDKTGDYYYNKCSFVPVNDFYIKEFTPCKIDEDILKSHIKSKKNLPESGLPTTTDPNSGPNES